jgi:hypothetical protein
MSSKARSVKNNPKINRFIIEYLNKHGEDPSNYDLYAGFLDCLENNNKKPSDCLLAKGRVEKWTYKKLYQKIQYVMKFNANLKLLASKLVSNKIVNTANG